MRSNSHFAGFFTVPRVSDRLYRSRGRKEAWVPPYLRVRRDRRNLAYTTIGCEAYTVILYYYCTFIYYLL